MVDKLNVYYEVESLEVKEELILFLLLRIRNWESYYLYYTVSRRHLSTPSYPSRDLTFSSLNHRILWFILRYKQSK